jgi:hypothetical protein
VTARARSTALALLAACGGEPGGPVNLPPAAIDFVAGAVEPVVARGDIVVIEGYGFGATPGSGGVTFAAAVGGPAPAALPDSASWTDLAVAVIVPANAVSGILTLTTGDGHVVTATVHVLPAVPFDPATLTWQARAAFPRAPVGIALTVAEFPSAGALGGTLYAAGGAEPLGGDSVFVPDSSVYLARLLPGGDVAAWTRQPDPTDPARSRALPEPRAFAAAAVATRYNARLPIATGVLYVVGGIDAAGRPQRTVFGADVTADSVIGPFVPLEPLPAPVAGAIALVRRGVLYVIGGTDSLGLPRTSVYVARVAATGQIDGWYAQPALPAPRAYGGGAALDRRIVAFGGMQDQVPPGGGLDATPPRLASGDTAALSRVSGFFAGAWGVAADPFPEPRSQFATLHAGNAVLVVGGMYGGAATNAAETIAATATGDSLGPFAGPVGTNTITALGGGTLIGPAGATWRDASGAWHGVVVGGMDLGTRLRVTGAWGF